MYAGVLRYLFMAVVLAAFICSMPACRKPAETEEIESMSQDPILSERIDKDRFFRSSDESPIPAEERGSFQGLVYYPVNIDLRFSVRLNRYPNPDSVRLSTNTGEIRSGLRYGYFDITVNGQSVRLQVYRLDSATANGGPNLFIPFRDATSGTETYGAGRYIDLTENTSGMYVLDFNRAYNPWCAFNSSFSCPLPPPENVLSVPIRAGEKMPH